MQIKQRQLLSTLNDFYHKPIAKVSLELFLSLGLIVVLGIFAIQPTLTTMSRLIKEIDEKKQLDKNMSSKIAALSSAQSIYYASQSKLSLLDEAIPNRPKLINSLKIVEKLATENNLILLSMTVSEVPSETESQNTATTLERSSTAISLTVKGDYLSIKNFVQALLDSRRSFVVEAVTFSLEKNRREESLSATITIDMPYFGK